MLSRALALVEESLAADTPEAASDAFFHAMEPWGASYLQTRRYQRPEGTLTNASHWAAGGVIKRIAPQPWPGSEAFNYICFECNPLLDAINQSLTRYRFSDLAPHDVPAFGRYWDALGEAGIEDALCATSYGRDWQVASLHLGFHRRTFEPDEAMTIHLAGLMLTERLMDLPRIAAPGMVTPRAANEREALTPRERDCLAFVAAGKTDWEISVILGVSQSTAKFHVDNARRKLGAVNRAQAVARFVLGERGVAG